MVSSDSGAFLTTAEAAQRFNPPVTSAWVCRLIRSGDLPATRDRRGAWCVDATAVAEMVRAAAVARRQPKPKKQCECGCGEQFTPKYPSQRFKSPGCVHRRYHDKPQPRVCANPNCPGGGEPFIPKRLSPSAGGGWTEHCSPKCAGESKRIRPKPEMHECECGCGEVFMQKYPGQRFETTDCKVRAQRKHPLAEPRECDCGCGEIFTPDSWELDRRFKKRECYARWLRKHPAEPRECECGCGTIFIPDGWNAANGGGHYLNSQHAWRHYWKVGKGPPRGRIAKASGGSRQRWLGDWDGGRPQVDADEIIEILRLDERGHSRQGIADRVGRSKPSVIRVMTIVQMHAEGSPVSEIAHRAHTSERVANHVISAATKV